MHSSEDCVQLRQGRIPEVKIKTKRERKGNGRREKGKGEEGRGKGEGGPEQAHEETVTGGRLCMMEKAVHKEMHCAQGYRRCAIESCNKDLV